MPISQNNVIISTKNNVIYTIINNHKSRSIISLQPSRSASDLLRVNNRHFIKNMNASQADQYVYIDKKCNIPNNI